MSPDKAGKNTIGFIPPSNIKVKRHQSLDPRCCNPLKDTSNDSGIRVVGNYDIGRTIGKGKFGTVKIATHVLTQDTVAVKIINKKKLNETALTMLRREIAILKKLSHPNIIQLYEIMETTRVMFIIMEYANGGEALDFVVTHGKLSESKARRFFRQIISGIAYCHKNNVAHRDLKAENLLLDGDLNIKLIDFGLSNIITEKKLSTPCGSPHYAAPELIQRLEYNGPEVDVWALGVILYVFLTGALPFQGETMEQLFNNILSGNYAPLSSDLSEASRDLINSMLCVNPDERITLSNIARHEWVVGDDNWILKENDKSIDENINCQIDSTITNALATLGYNPSEVIESVKNNRYNDATATLKLLSRQKSNRTIQENRSYPTPPLSICENSTKLLGVSSVPNSAATSPVNQNEIPPPSISKIEFSALPPPKKETFYERKKRILESRKRRHSRRKSDVSSMTISKSEELSASIEIPKKRKRSTSSQSQLSRINGSKGDISESPSEEKELRFADDENPKDVDLNSSKEEDKETFVIELPRQRRGHRRYASVDISNGKEVNLPKSELPTPVTLPVWSDATSNETSGGVRKLTEQDEINWKKIEESERQQISIAKNTPFSSIIHWTKQMLHRPTTGTNEPREIRTAFNSSTTSRKSPKETMNEVKRILDELKITYEETTPYCLRAHCPTKKIDFEIEVCSPPNLSSIYVIRLCRISGDWLAYRDLCQGFLQSLKLSE